MKQEKYFVEGKLTGIIGENPKKNTRKNQSFEQEFGEEFEPIQQMWGVNPVDEEEYNGTVGYKDS